MKNNLKKLLVMLLAANMFAGATLPTFAEEVVSRSETEIAENEDGTKTEITTTVTEETDEEGNTTITVKIEEVIDETTGNVTDDGVTVNYEQTTTTTTTTDEEGTEISGSKVVEGSETKSWTEEDSGDEEGQPEVEVELIPGEKTEATAEETTVTGDEKNGTETTVTDRTVNAEVSDVTSTITSSVIEITTPQTELKFDRNDKNDQSQQKKDRELYTDNGHFTDPDSITVTDAPDESSFKYVGYGDYSGHYVSHIRVIYERDENGNALKDENGEYIIKELQHSNGTVLTKNGVPTTDLEGPYDQTTGTRPTQFLLMNEAGESVYAYCIDLDTGAVSNSWYSVANLEDNDYYASEEAENHVRNIVMNGYWGTSSEQKEDGTYETGSLAKVKEDLKKALADGKLPAEQDVTFVLRGAKYTEGYELQEGEYVGNGYICKQVTEHIVLTDEVIDALTEGEAFDATQMAIWSYANGSNHALDGTDRMIVGDVYYGSSALGDSLNKKNDYAGAARTRALYEYLINLNEKQESTIVINEKNNIDNLSLTIGDKADGFEANYDDNADNDVYEAELNFTLEFVPDPESDDLLVHVTYMQNGEEVVVTRRLAGENTEERNAETITAVNGVYTLPGLHLSENSDFTFDLRLEGIQYLEKGAYVYTAQGGVDKSQTMIGIMEGKHSVDVSKSLTVSFDVDEDNHVVAERHWYEEIDPEIDPEDPTEDPEDPTEDPEEPTEEPKDEGPKEDPKDPTEDPKPEETPKKRKFSFKLKVEEEPEVVEIPEEEIPLVNIPDEEIPLTDIPDEPVPLTGDSMFWYISSAAAVLGLCVLNLFGKKKNHNA